VNEHGGFGRWASAVSFGPSDVADVLARHGAMVGIAPEERT